MRERVDYSCFVPANTCRDRIIVRRPDVALSSDQTGVLRVEKATRRG